MADQANKSSIFAFVSALAWPVFAFTALILFFHPLVRLLEVLPETISNTSAVSAGGVTIQLNRNLAQRATPELVRVLGAMSWETISFVLAEDLANKSITFTSREELSEKRRNSELVRLGLCSYLSPEELRKAEQERRTRNEKVSYLWGISCNVLYAQVQGFLLAVIEETVSKMRPRPKE